jgi:hypothetical protein
MVDRVNGSPKEGVWFSADVRFLNVVATNGDFANDISTELVDSGLEQALEALATRGTIIGLNVVNATTFEVMVDYAQAYDDTDVVAEVEALIDAVASPVNLSSAAITVNTLFAGA